MAYYVLSRPTMQEIDAGGGGVARALGAALGRAAFPASKPIDKDTIQRALAGLGTPGELNSIMSAFGVQDQQTTPEVPAAPAFDAGQANMSIPGIAAGLPTPPAQNANMSVPGVQKKTPADLLRGFFGVTQQEAARKMAGFGNETTDSAVTYRDALKGMLDGKYDADYVKRNFPDKDPSDIDAALDRSRPIGMSAGFREGGGLEAYGSNRVAKISDSTRSVIENLKVYGVKGLKDFLSDIEGMRSAGVDPAAIIEYYGDDIKKHGLQNLVPNDLRKHL